MRWEQRNAAICPHPRVSGPEKVQFSLQGSISNLSNSAVLLHLPSFVSLFFWKKTKQGRFWQKARRFTWFFGNLPYCQNIKLVMSCGCPSRTKTGETSPDDPSMWRQLPTCLDFALFQENVFNWKGIHKKWMKIYCKSWTRQCCTRGRGSSKENSEAVSFFWPVATWSTWRHQHLRSLGFFWSFFLFRNEDVKSSKGR